MNRDVVKREAKSLAVYLFILAVLLYMVDMRVGGLKDQINTVVRFSCQSNAQAGILGKYNDVVQTQIDANLQAQKINEASGEAAKAALNAATAARLKADLIPVVKQDCSKPLLH